MKVILMICINPKNITKQIKQTHTRANGPCQMKRKIDWDANILDLFIKIFINLINNIKD